MSSVLKNAAEFKFGDLDLHGALIKWNDVFEIRFAKFEYLKRSGAVQEPMGAAAAKFSMQCVYMGPQATSNYQRLVNKVRSRPRDFIIHPRLGRIDVVCKALRAGEDPPQAIDTIDFTLDFEENQLDDQFDTLSPGPISGQVTVARQETSASMTAVFPPLTNPSPIDSVNQAYAIVRAAQVTFDTAADKFTTAALQIAQSPLLDPQLSTLLGLVQAQQVAFEIALRNTGRTDAELFPILQSVRRTSAACINLYNAVLAQKPPIVPFVVPAAMSLSEVALRLYGADARDFLPQLQQLNPSLKTPYLIPQGTILQVNAPFVRQ